MADLAKVIRGLTAERKRLQTKLNALDSAISVLSQLGVSSRRVSRRGPRKMSAAGRARIAAAQKKRWAAWRKKNR